MGRHHTNVCKFAMTPDRAWHQEICFVLSSSSKAVAHAGQWKEAWSTAEDPIISFQILNPLDSGTCASGRVTNLDLRKTFSFRSTADRI